MRFSASSEHMSDSSPQRHRRVLGAAVDSASHSKPSADEAVMNSRYVAGEDSIWILLDEVLNNDTRAVFVYDDFTGSFTDDDACALAAVLRYNTSLLSITLNGVDVGDSAVGHICDALVRSRVRLIDLSNTFLADEAGASLLALALCNRNLRTIIVDETLIDEEIMDEIDMACLNNEQWEVQEPPPMKRTRASGLGPPRLCVQNCFGACPNGQYCMLSHRTIQMTPRGKGGQAKGTPLPLPQRPSEGPSWRRRDEASTGYRIRQDDDQPDGDSRRGLLSPTETVFVATCALSAAVLFCAALFRVKRRP